MPKSGEQNNAFPLFFSVGVAIHCPNTETSHIGERLAFREKLGKLFPSTM